MFSRITILNSAISFTQMRLRDEQYAANLSYDIYDMYQFTSGGMKKSSSINCFFNKKSPNLFPFLLQIQYS